MRDRSTHGHFIEKCECGRILNQCRCLDPNKEVRVVGPCKHMDFDPAKSSAPVKPEPEPDIEWFHVEEVMTRWRPGSHYEDRTWTWANEAAELFLEPSHRRTTLKLLEEIAHQGIYDPITLGNDGRVWDGHHRLVIARLLGIPAVPCDVAKRGVKKEEVMEVVEA